MKDNDVIQSVALLEHVKGSLHADSRSQLSRTELTEIQRLLGQVLNKLVGKGEELGNIKIELLSVHDLIAQILQDEDVDTTDTDTKNMIAGPINSAMEALCIKAGKYYYQDNEFDYYLGLDDLLQRIIRVCVKSGFFFGVEA